MIPLLGQIYLIQNSQIINKTQVQNKWKDTLFLRQTNSISKGWILDVLNCIDRIQKDEFSLNDVYNFESELKKKYPNNKFVKDKIRQQLQLLRDKGIIEFTGSGKYKKISYDL
jgi:type II restriction enzyme